MICIQLNRNRQPNPNLPNPAKIWYNVPKGNTRKEQRKCQQRKKIRRNYGTVNGWSRLLSVRAAEWRLKNGCIRNFKNATTIIKLIQRNGNSTKKRQHCKETETSSGCIVSFIEWFAKKWNFRYEIQEKKPRSFGLFRGYVVFLCVWIIMKSNEAVMFIPLLYPYQFS